ncbi:MAG TPA: hypothetical protein DEQ77_01930 [Candidatus Omnitrophica bacterium]|nr:hypothetical protein [Candidatus Omnitrophota bacterium]
MKTGLKKPQLVLDYNGIDERRYAQEDVIRVDCPFCDSNDFSLLATERRVIGVVRCNTCGLIYVNPRLKSPEKVYWGDESGYYEEAKLVFCGLKPHHRDKNYADDLGVIKKFKPRGNFLDIGTNAGFFLRLAKKNKEWNLFGVEPSLSLAQLARKYFSLNIINSFLEEATLENDFFDIVTMTDVFEHVPNPMVILGKVHKIIKADGILFIKVPNGLFNITKLHLTKLTRQLGEYDIFDSYEHLVHYSHNTLAKMLAKGGFKVIFKGIGRPIQTPVWQKYTGKYYQYPSPFILDYKNQILRNVFYFTGAAEYFLFGCRAGYLAPNITVVAQKV